MAAHFGYDMCGAGIREAVRRTVQSSSGAVSTDDLITTVKAGRFKSQLPTGNYLSLS